MGLPNSLDPAVVVALICVPNVICTGDTDDFEWPRCLELAEATKRRLRKEANNEPQHLHARPDAEHRPCRRWHGPERAGGLGAASPW
jgi:hypothetical protein